MALEDRSVSLLRSRLPVGQPYFLKKSMSIRLTTSGTSRVSVCPGLSRGWNSTCGMVCFTFSLLEKGTTASFFPQIRRTGRFCLPTAVKTAEKSSAIK